MSFTMADKLESLKLDRTLAINVKVATINDKNTALKEDNFTKAFFYGDATNIGVNDLIKLYYDEKEYEQGTLFSQPPLTSWTDAKWENYFNASLHPNGDGATGFYPPDQYGIASQDMNMNSLYLTNNGESEGTTGILALIKNVDDAIGDTSGHGGAYWHMSGYDYANSAAALSAGESYTSNLKTNATGIRWWRTSNVEVYTEEKSGDSVWRYKIGDSLGDSGDTYSPADKTTLVNALNTLSLTVGDTASSYRQKLSTLYSEITKIKGDSNPYFYNGTKFIGDTNGDSVTKLMNDLDTYAGDSTIDDEGDSTLWGYRNYFNSANGAEADFDNQLDALEIVNNNVKTTIETRHDNINILIGSNLTSDNLKKLRLFWIENRIGKPVASLINHNGLSSAIDIAIDKLGDKDGSLNFLLNDSTIYIPKPEFYIAYEDNKYNKETGAIVKRKITIIYGGQQHITDYKIYRKEMADVEYNNTAWGDTYVITTIDTVNDVTGFVERQYTDTYKIYADKKYCYRVKCIDTDNDSFTSSSEQSDIYLENTEDTFISIINKIDYRGDTVSVLDMGAEHDFKKGEYVMLDATHILSANSFYKIVDVDDEVISIQPQVKINSTDTGKIYKCNGMVFL